MISADLLTKLAIFGAVAIGVWWLLELLATGKPRAERGWKNSASRTPAAATPGATKRSDGMTRLLERATPEFLQAAAAKDRRRSRQAPLEARLRRLPQRDGRQHLPRPQADWLGGRFPLGWRLAAGDQGLDDGNRHVHGRHPPAWLSTCPTWCSGSSRRSRQDNIFFGLPDALDLMVVCVEAGLGLDQAMRKVSEEMKKTYAVIAEEFGLCNLQLQMGRPRNEVLHELGAAPASTT